jgi:hypothetical protein
LENHFSNGTSAILQLLLHGQRMLKSASKATINSLARVLMFASGLPDNHWFHKIKISAQLKSLPLMLLTLCNVVNMETILLCACKITCAR